MQNNMAYTMIQAQPMMTEEEFARAFLMLNLDERAAFVQETGRTQ